MPGKHWLSEAQKEALSKKANGKQTAGQQWYAIWDIVFPGKRHPPSPYIDASLSEDFTSFLGFYQSLDMTMLLDIVQSEGFHLEVEQLRVLLQLQPLLLRRIYDTWAHERGHIVPAGTGELPGVVETPSIFLENPGPTQPDVPSLPRVGQFSQGSGAEAEMEGELQTGEADDLEPNDVELLDHGSTFDLGSELHLDSPPRFDFNSDVDFDVGLFVDFAEEDVGCEPYDVQADGDVNRDTEAP
ncbi:hypothetical protein OQA88_1244 [Cercophora sp. LCS_1]